MPGSVKMPHPVFFIDQIALPASPAASRPA